MNLSCIGHSLTDVGDLYLEREESVITGYYNADTAENFLIESECCMIVSKDLKKGAWLNNMNQLPEVQLEHRPVYKNNKWKAKKCRSVNEKQERDVLWHLCRNPLGEFFLYIGA